MSTRSSTPGPRADLFFTLSKRIRRHGRGYRYLKHIGLMVGHAAMALTLPSCQNRLHVFFRIPMAPDPSENMVKTAVDRKIDVTSPPLLRQ